MLLRNWTRAQQLLRRATVHSKVGVLCPYQQGELSPHGIVLDGILNYRNAAWAETYLHTKPTRLPGQLSLLPSAGREMSTSQRAVIRLSAAGG